MDFEVSSNSLDNISADAILLFAFEQKEGILPSQGFLMLDKVLKNQISDFVKQENFKAKEGELVIIHTCDKILAPKVFVLGFGKKEEFNQNILRKVISGFAKSNSKKLSSVALLILEEKDFKIGAEVQSQVTSEGFLLGVYQFNKYKKKDEDVKELSLIIFSESNKNMALKIKEGVRTAEIFSNATKLCRDLVNEPSAVVDPTFLAQLAQDLSKKNKDLKCTVYDRLELEKIGMGAFLGVAKGAETPPKFIHLEYCPKGLSHKKQKLAIVGKGITFDSGGLSIKRGESMFDMKMDMAGAAVVLSVFSVISEIKPQMCIMGLIAATPNLISGKSLAPGDVLKAMNGTTIEVLHTDAEGRLTLADSLSYAVKKGATEIIDLATLTGACMVALGTEYAGLMGNNEELKSKLLKVAKETGEKVWELPLVKEYKELNKSEVADVSNTSSSRYGVAITGGLFLEEFVDSKPWVHLDIAGPAYAEKSFELGPKGGTGFGVRLMLNYLKSL
ncbi:MAG: leucyl aminopeptidase [Candidatus Levyibacteriota bacterium]